jgi:hypothetical protein
MDANGKDRNTDARDTLYVAGGAALMLFGAGLVMAHPGLRKMMLLGVSRALPDLEKPLRQGVAGLLPDVERYLKIRSM